MRGLKLEYSLLGENEKMRESRLEAWSTALAKGLNIYSAFIFVTLCTRFIASSNTPTTECFCICSQTSK